MLKRAFFLLLQVQLLFEIWWVFDTEPVLKREKSKVSFFVAVLSWTRLKLFFCITELSELLKSHPTEPLFAVGSTLDLAYFCLNPSFLTDQLRCCFVYLLLTTYWMWTNFSCSFSWRKIGFPGRELQCQLWLKGSVHSEFLIFVMIKCIFLNDLRS